MQQVAGALRPHTVEGGVGPDAREAPRQRHAVAVGGGEDAPLEHVGHAGRISGRRREGDRDKDGLGEQLGVQEVEPTDGWHPKPPLHSARGIRNDSVSEYTNEGAASIRVPFSARAGQQAELPADKGAGRGSTARPGSAGRGGVTARAGIAAGRPGCVDRGRVGPCRHAAKRHTRSPPLESQERAWPA